LEKLKVEKNIPMPPKGSRANMDKYADVQSMEIGDSILFHDKKDLYKFINYSRRNYDFKGAQRHIADSQWRWWRTA